MTGDSATSPAPDLRVVLRAALKEAMKGRDRVAASALRSGLAAIDNAEAVPTEHTVRSDGDSPIAGAAVGLGATEVARRELGPEDVHAVIESEIAERRDAAAEVEAAGRPDRAVDLHREADVLESALRVSTGG